MYSPTNTVLTLTQAAALPPLPGVILPLAPVPLVDSIPLDKPYKVTEPTKIFDNVYWVGTNLVGSFIVDTFDGLAMIDTGYTDVDCKVMVDGIKELGLDPAKINLIIISHEHRDHYGGVPYLKKNVCPNALVAFSLAGWNILQTVPLEWAYVNPRPQHTDIYLVDGMRFKLGNTTFQCVATPGHSPGCMSFILPVKDNGVTHMFGFMGGTAVWATQLETRQYQASIEYFKAFALAAKCEAGFGVHAQETQLAKLRARKPSEPNPLIVGTDKYDSVYLQPFRDRVKKMVEGGGMVPYEALRGTPPPK